MQGVAGLAGWQWLFVIEGLPACILGLVVLLLLPDDPGHAAWLTAEEKETIAGRVAIQDSTVERQVWPALRDPRVWALGLVNVALLFSNQGTQLWFPQIVKEMGFSNLAVGFIVALPYLFSLPAMVLWGRSGDMRDERIWHVALPALLAAGGFAVASLAQSDLVSLLAIALAAIGLVMMTPSLFSLISSFLSGPAAAAGMALVISIGNVGSFLGPSVVGLLKQATGDFAAAMASFAIALGLAALVVLATGRAMAPRTAMARPETSSSR